MTKDPLVTREGRTANRAVAARWSLGLLALVAVAGPAPAQRPRVSFEEIKVGLPPGRYVAERDSAQRGSPIAKRNTWAPIYVRLKMEREFTDGGIQLKIESADADDLRTTLVVPLLKTLADRRPGEMIEPTELAYVPYVRCGDRGGQVTLTVLSDVPGEEPKALSETKRIGTGGNFIPFRDVSTYVVLSLGSNLPGFTLPEEDRKGPQSGTTRGGLRGGRVETAAITNVREMPDQWFGYQAADLVVLTTGATQGEFLDELFDREKSIPFKDRRDALLEWVRRGGKLVVSVGSNASKVAPSELFQGMLPARVKTDPPTREVAELPLRWQTAGLGATSQPLAPKGEGKFKVAQLVVTPNRPADVLIPQSSEALADPALAELPVVVQAPYGLGRVTVVAFDLDQSPFADFPKKAQFWDWLIRNAGSEKAALAPSQPTNQYNSYGITDTEDEFAAALRQHIDTFEGVPVISFGWVALFIILYTLLIGPVEYLFLKKVLGRLELTWITFPVIVLSVSAAAYFTAYAIKGNDLKLNKVDVVDVDLAGGRVYGRTWLTVFSPRIDSYTVGVEPKGNWAAARPDGPTPSPLVDWMGGGRGGASSFLSRGYSYHVDPDARVIGDALVRVPIQVWSTKAFTANWTGYTDKGTPPIAAELVHPPGDPDAVQGSFVNNLPVGSLPEPVLFYAGKAYKLPTLTPGQRVSIPATKQGSGLPPDADWLTRNASVNLGGIQSGYNQWGGRQQVSPTSSSLSLWGLLFHEKAVPRDNRGLNNATLRTLDQSWRLDEDNRNEAVLLARVETVNGQARDILNDPGGASPTGLWLKDLPQPGANPPDIPGTLRQETYIRVYSPITPAGGRK